MFDPRYGMPRTACIMVAGLSVLLWGCVEASSMGAQGGGARQASGMKPAFTSDDQLTRPVEYREWVYIGTPLTPNELNPPEAPFPEFHNVYIHPDDYTHYRESGEYRHGTVIIKELVSVASKQAASGSGYFMGEFIGLEAAVKDTSRFDHTSRHWGYFSFGHVPERQYAMTATALPAETCAACHFANAAEDMVFTQYYPVLRAAKAGAAAPPARSTTGGGSNVRE